MRSSHIVILNVYMYVCNDIYIYIYICAYDQQTVSPRMALRWAKSEQQTLPSHSSTWIASLQTSKRHNYLRFRHVQIWRTFCLMPSHVCHVQFYVHLSVEFASDPRITPCGTAHWGWQSNLEALTCWIGSRQSYASIDMLTRPSVELLYLKFPRFSLKEI